MALGSLEFIANSCRIPSEKNTVDSVRHWMCATFNTRTNFLILVKFRNVYLLQDYFWSPVFYVF